MRTRYLTLAIIFMLAAAPIYAGTVYYVNGANGNDSNPGAQLAPWKTIQKAANIMIAGDEVIVAAGNYPERVTLTRPGVDGAMISFTATGTVECRGFTVSTDYILISGFKVTGTGTNWDPTAHGFWVTGKYCIIENNYAYYSGRGGIHLRPSSSNCIVRNNRCNRNGMVGIEVHGTNHLIENNEVWGSISYHTPTGLIGDADGMRFFGSGHIFRGNYIHDIKFDDPENVGYDPHIDAFQTWTNDGHVGGTNILFEKNRIVLPVYKTVAAHGTGWTLHNCSYITIRNNIVYAHGGTQTYGTQTAAAGLSHHITIVNNTFIGRLDFIPANNPVGIDFQNCANSTVNNNIIINQVAHAVYIDSASLVGMNISNNCCYNDNGSMPSDTHHPYDQWGLNPSFVNPAAGDYRLKSDSPCINTGMTIPEIVDDYSGQPRPSGGAYDIGAYEFVGQISSPSVTTSAAGSITSTGATVGGNVSSDGGAAVTERGVCWGLTANPTTSSSHTQAGSGTGSFTTTLSGLSQTTAYHVRAYATNSQGTSYGSDVTFTTSQSVTSPSVTTSAAGSITSTGTTAGGNVSSDGGAAVTERGVCWGLTANPTTSSSHTQAGSGTGSFTTTLSGLSQTTAYHVRAYATNSSGTSYGSDVTFTTSTVTRVPTNRTTKRGKIKSRINR